jgi:hypothetical protein
VLEPLHQLACGKVRLHLLLGPRREIFDRGGKNGM